VPFPRRVPHLFQFALLNAVVVCFCFLLSIEGPALPEEASAGSSPVFTTLATFTGTGGSGADPEYGPLVQGFDGNFYGTTSQGGKNCGSCGTVFKITSAGKLTTLYSFCSKVNNEGTCIDGVNPYGGLVVGINGNLYGTTENGGTSENCVGGCGTVYEITLAGKLTTLHSFEGSDGRIVNGGLVQASGGNLYGTTQAGGTNDDGTVFKITPQGTLTTLHSFDSIDGKGPQAALIEASNGGFYGTTPAGGANNSGTVFQITSGGKLTVLHSFCGQTGCPDGADPVAVALVQISSGNFNGTTSAGGANNSGTVFELTPGGKLTVLYSFRGTSTNGAFPYSGLVKATDGNFYGTTEGGGGNPNCQQGTVFGCGTIFKITSEGTVTTLHTFTGEPPEGVFPYAGLLQATTGTFYGTTTDLGTVFSLGVGLGPFVETVPTSGIEGATVIILGTDLTGATKVSFNGTPAKFTVISGTEMKTTVPANAKTGTVEVTTPGGKLKSNLIFRATPQITSFTPTSGAAGITVTINGTELTQTTQVTFDGVKATTFAVKSDSEVTADVPAGAKTGKIAVTTPGGAVTSSGTFTVTP
jgi:uncharacterized repeat protein (TIGR03803 family)